MITGKTKIIGIFGDPVEHSLSPVIHNEAFKYLGLDYCYVPFHVKKEKLKKAVEALRALNIKGVNITIPHKEAIIPLLDELSEEAYHIEAVNTVLNSEGYLKGFNTDTYGFVLSLKEEGILLNDRNVIVLGAGGAARAVVYGILKEGSRVYIFNRTRDRAKKIVEKFRQFGFIEVIDKIDESVIEMMQIVVNATSLGLKKEDPMPLSPQLLKPEHIYCDIVYPETPLMKEAEKIGCKVTGGSGMLVWQAAFAFEIWTGRQAPIEIMRQALHKVLTKNYFFDTKHKK